MEGWVPSVLTQGDPEPTFGRGEDGRGKGFVRGHEVVCVHLLSLQLTVVLHLKSGVSGHVRSFWTQLSLSPSVNLEFQGSQTLDCHYQDHFGRVGRSSG